MRKKTSGRQRGGFPSEAMFWSLGFVYALFMGLLLQKIILPLLPEMHAGHGLLLNDAIVFHNSAVEVAERIREYGWSAWHLFPNGNAGNVGLLSAVYGLLGPEPAWFLPLTSAAHATGALFIYRIGSRLWPSQVGMLGGLLGGIAFLSFPSALQWYGQNHKDAFAIAGTLMVLDAWLVLQLKAAVSQRKETVFLATQAIFGMTMAGIVRSYLPVLVAFALLSSWFAVTGLRLFYKEKPQWIRQILFLLGAVMLATLLARPGDLAFRTSAESAESAESAWHWERTDLLPIKVDKAFERISSIRVGFVDFGRSVGAGSDIDEDRLPTNVLEALAYTPRALFIGLFAPFPTTWGERMSLPRLVGAVETFLVYVFVLGCFVTVARRPSWPLLAGIVFCGVLITILAYANPNVGTLYRQRFGALQFFLLCGALGWASLILEILGRRKLNSTHISEPSPSAANEPPSVVSGTGMDRVLASGGVVVLITLLSYLGFLARDLLLAGYLGVGRSLDNLFTAMMIPMFFVSFICMPLTDALAPLFSHLRGNAVQGEQERRVLVRQLLGFSMFVLAIVAIGVIAAAPQLLSFVLVNPTSDRLAAATPLLRWFAPVIVFSAGTIIGNATLNILFRSRDAALGQLIVPVVAITALLFATQGEESVAAVQGMLLGTLLNMGWVFFRLRLFGITLLPCLPSFEVIKPLAPLYFPLLLSALLTAASVPMNYMFSAPLAAGAVSTWALASKIVVLFSGVMSVTASAVVLPHLALMFSHDQQHVVKNDGFFLLKASNWLGGILVLGAVLFADGLIGVLLPKGIEEEVLSELGLVIKIGVLQIPFAIIVAVIAKMTTASRAPSRILIPAALGLATNLVVNLLFVSRLGILGVAMGALLGSVVLTSSLLVMTRRLLGMTGQEIFVLLLGALMWIGVCAALYSQSTAAIVCAVFIIFGVGLAQFFIVRGGDQYAASA